MCLFSKEKEMIATCDIPCVKVLMESDGKRYTPFYDKRVPRIVLWGFLPFRARGEKEVKQGRNGVFVKKGYIHVFDSLNASLSAIANWLFIGDKFEHYECVIPKGTHYWVSCDGSMYAAKKIKFVRKI